MIRYSSRTSIAAPAHVVFETLLDSTRYGEWTDMSDMSFETEPRVGAKGSFRLANGPLRDLLALEIVELDPDRRVVFRITHETLTWIATADLAAEGSRTTFTYAGEMRLHGWRRILEPLVRLELGRGEAREAERLRDLVEHATGGRDAPVAVPG